MTTALIIALTYKIICLLVGLTAIYLGYKLFIKGFLQEQGELKIEKASVNLAISKIAPDIYFSLFGTFVILLAIFKDASFTFRSYPTNAIVGSANVRKVDSAKGTETIILMQTSEKNNDKDKIRTYWVPVDSDTVHGFKFNIK